MMAVNDPCPPSACTTFVVQLRSYVVRPGQSTGVSTSPSAKAKRGRGKDWKQTGQNIIPSDILKCQPYAHANVLGVRHGRPDPCYGAVALDH